MRTFAQKPKAPQRIKSAISTTPSRASLGQSRDVRSMLQLLRTIGNQAVQRKLAINKPGDNYEQQADRIAARVMKMPEPKRQPAYLCGGGYPVCQQRQVTSELMHFQAKHAEASDVRKTKAPPIVQEALRAAGQPLETAIRAFMEPRFGHEFGRVRVHSDPASAKSAQAISARAYTVGHNIVFAAGQYSPHTAEGKQLIAHELTHVIQQQGGAGRMVYRDVQTASAEERREFVETAITFLDGAADSYRLATVDEARLERTLEGLKGTVEGSQRIITADLGGDAALLGRLRDAYRSAVAELIRVASRQLNRTTHDIYQSQRERIHEWAWVRSSADPAAHMLGAALPEAERRRITVITSSVSIPNLDGLFSTRVARTTIPLPQGVTTSFAGAIPSGLEHGLRNVAGTLIPNPLTLNSTITLALDLEAHGGDFGAYRFTYVQHTPAQGPQTQEVLIEHLGSVGIEGLTESQRDAQRQRFRQHRFSRGSGWSDEEFEALLEAIAQIPDGMLTPVDGLTFERATAHPTDPRAGGDYNPDTHSITMYDQPFSASLARFGTPGAGGVSTDAVRSVVHEIGHAVDLRPLRQAWNTLEQAQNAFRAVFRQHENPPGSGNYSFPSNMQMQFNTLQQQITQAEQALTQARSASGHRWQLQSGTWEIVQGGTGAGSNAFRQAAQQDGGVRVTDYSNTEWQEYFAESYSLYITNPTVLRQLRPRVYAYFVATYPR